MNKITLEQLKTLSHLDRVKFALFCANQVKHLMRDERSLNALLKIELFIEGKATKEEIKSATHAASYAASDIAYAASYAADAAYAASYAASDIAYAASYAAAAAAHAAHAVKSDIKERQIEYFNKLSEGELK